MNLLLLFALKLLLIGGLIDGAPNSEKSVGKSSKKVKIDDKPTIIVDPTTADQDENLIMHIIKKDLDANVQKMSDLFEESSTERKFIRAIGDVIQSNNGMYQKLYGYMNGLVSYETELCQVEKNGSHEEESSSDYIFPNPKVFEKLVKEKGMFKEKLILLLNWLEPAHKLNEHLIQMMNSMDADTKIDSKLYNEMVDESKKVSEINGSFEKVFRNFPIESYKKNLNLVRKASNYIEDQIMVKRIPKISQICPNMKKTVKEMHKTLRTALKIEFEQLNAATKKFHGIVMEALKVDGSA